MASNKIFNVARIINKRYQGNIENLPLAIRNVEKVVGEIYGRNYITNDDLVALVNLMYKYSK